MLPDWLTAATASAAMISPPEVDTSMVSVVSCFMLATLASVPLRSSSILQYEGCLIKISLRATVVALPAGAALPPALADAAAEAAGVDGDEDEPFSLDDVTWLSLLLDLEAAAAAAAVAAAAAEAKTFAAADSFDEVTLDDLVVVVVVADVSAVLAICLCLSLITLHLGSCQTRFQYSGEGLADGSRDDFLVRGLAKLSPWVEVKRWRV